MLVLAKRGHLSQKLVSEQCRRMLVALRLQQLAFIGPLCWEYSMMASQGSGAWS